MFDKVYVRRFETITGAFNLGMVAELALFYKELVVEINIGWLIKALAITSSDTLIRMHKEFGVRFVFMVDGIGVMTQTDPGGFIPTHLMSTYEIAKTARKKDGKQELIDRILVTPLPNEDRYSIKRFLDICDFKHHKDMIQKGQRFEDIVGNEILDKPLSAADMSEIVRSMAPGYELPDNVVFHGVKTDPRDARFVLLSNIDMKNLNRHRTHQTGEDIGDAHLLSMYANARFELSACASQGCDFVSDYASGAIIRRRVSDLLHATNSRLSELDLFQERTLGESKAIAEAIDTGARSLDDFLSVMEQASKFKKFIANLDSESGLIDEYIREVSARSWIDALPKKLVRFGMLQAAAISAGFALNPVAGATFGLGLSAFDSFVIDKLAHRWRPNQFVDDVLKPFASHG
jgi:hypothetical protein